ncbi:unnamed protein product [Mytilus coruscus]|uniref:ZMYM2-like/QRICH1 C-terminal domain-containing protein n=1 Tax=Mytilus coruscus TaxID=42192 RepID=A0A6J8BHN0_MYTCO|nr:unnamed protein product [Mytilus coruscus]
MGTHRYILYSYIAKSPSPIKTNENTEIEVDSAVTAETETQPQTLETQPIPQIPDIDVLDDSFTTQISEIPNCDFEKFLSTISEENLNVMAEQNAKFHSRFVTNDENERATFIEQRENLNTIRKMNSALGLGNHPNAAEALESEDEEELYSSGGFGTDDPDSLLSTIWYMNTIHFGLRGTHEHRQLKWGDLKLETDRNENQCLTYNKRLT